MARCEGIKKDGARCRRSAAEGSTYCSIHAESAASEDERADATVPGTNGQVSDVQQGAEPSVQEAAEDDARSDDGTGAAAESDDGEDAAGEEAGDDGKGEPSARKKHPLADVAVIGAVAIALLLLRRVIRL